MTPRLLDDSQYWPILIGLSVLVFCAVVFLIVYITRGGGRG